MHSDSLWPEDLFAEKFVAPVQILKEQAKYLSSASQRTILGKVATGRAHSSAYGSYGHTDETADVIHTFQLVVPGLGDYTFDLFQIRHQPRALYPVFLEFPLEDEYHEIRIDDEDEFRRTMGNVLSSRETISVIRTLRAQTEDPDTLPPKLETKEPPTQLPMQSGEDDDIPF